MGDATAGRTAVGIDIGTSSVKVSLISESGEVTTATSSPYPTSHPHPDWSEQDPALWWPAIGEAVGTVLAGRRPSELIVGLTGGATSARRAWWPGCRRHIRTCWPPRGMS